MTSELVGTAIPTTTVQVSDRQAMNFAASVGDNNPWYFDDEREGGIIAPPMLTVSLIWPVALANAEILTSLGHGQAVRRQVHYTEHIAWNRMIRPGDTLTVSGSIVAVFPHAAGTHGLVRFEGRDPEGNLVFHETSGVMFRGIRMEGDGKGQEAMPQVPERVEAPAPAWESKLHMDPLQAHIFDGCADLHFPIHSSRKFAHKVGLPSTIIHGTCTLSMAVRELVNRELDGDPTRLRAVGCRFTGMVLPGTDVLVRLAGVSETDGRHLFFDVINADGKKAISEGFLTVA
jgi:acyl dehydratase